MLEFLAQAWVVLSHPALIIVMMLLASAAGVCQGTPIPAVEICFIAAFSAFVPPAFPNLPGWAPGVAAIFFILWLGVFWSLVFTRRLWGAFSFFEVGSLLKERFTRQGAQA